MVLLVYNKKKIPQWLKDGNFIRSHVKKLLYSLAALIFHKIKFVTCTAYPPPHPPQWHLSKNSCYSVALYFPFKTLALETQTPPWEFSTDLP